MKQYNEATPSGAKLQRDLDLKPSSCDIWHQCRVVLNEAFTDAAFSPQISIDPRWYPVTR